MNIVLKWVIKYVLIIKNEDLSTHIYLKHLISPNCFSKSNKSKKKQPKLNQNFTGQTALITNHMLKKSKQCSTEETFRPFANL